ncbi:MAG: 2'-5' RNA ligase family protein [Candidatus Omnitrophica bacterium]|nr:2'-5' RNA ligase family protein [Candidatus Omnitrophota bacterium]
MEKIAIDIVLFPPDDIRDKIIAINQGFIASHNNDIILNKKDKLPHITLAMGCIASKNLQQINDILKRSVQKWTSTKLRTLCSYKDMAWLKVEDQDSLRQFHDHIMDVAEPFFMFKAEGSMFYPEKDGSINKTTVDYVNNFKTCSSKENYEPHITIGHGITAQNFESFEFYPVSVAVCHLGNFCTCRRVLFEVIL